MFLKFLPLFAMMVLTLLTSVGCVSLPVTNSAEPSSSREPAGQGETAVVPVAIATAREPASLPTASPLQVTVEATPTVAVTPALTATNTATIPASTAMSAVATAGAATPAPALEHYRGPNPYRATPAFEVTYDPSTWEYAADDGSGRPSQLKHRTLVGCAIWLQAGPVDAKEMGQAYLAERAWSVAQVQPRAIQYSSKQGDLAFIIGVLLNEEYSGMANSNCQDAAEQVIDTFRVVVE